MQMRRTQNGTDATMEVVATTTTTTTPPRSPTSTSSSLSSTSSWKRPRSTDDGDVWMQRASTATDPADAVRAYQAALQVFQRTDAHASAATCWKHLGDLDRDRTAALEAYQHCLGRLRLAMKVASLSIVREEKEPEPVSGSGLDAMLVETLQKRASLLRQEPTDVLAAIECHEEVIAFLMDLNDHHHTRMPELSHTAFLLHSLAELTTLYPAVLARSASATVELGPFEDALEILRERLQQASSRPLALSVAGILVNLSEVYLEMGEMDSAFDCLDEAIELRLVHEEDVTGVLECIENLGQTLEEGEFYDQAMACYEKVLLVRNQLLGENDIVVAKSLVNVARVMELQDNVEGSLDLYRAAKAIYSNQLASEAINVEAEDAQTLLELVPTALEQGRFDDVVAYLSKCVDVAEDEEQNQAETKLDKTYIFFYLGRAYIGLRDYVSATICLMEAAKHEGAISEEQVFGVLQRVEFLQREGQQKNGLSTDDEDKDDAVGNLEAAPVAGPTEESQPVTPETVSVASKNEPVLTKQPSSTPDSPNDSKTVNTKQCDTSESDVEDEGTAYYDSESVSAFNPIPRSDYSSSVFDMDQLTDAADDIAISFMPTNSELEGSHIEIPDVLSDLAGDGIGVVTKKKMKEGSDAAEGIVEQTTSGESRSLSSRGRRMLTRKKSDGKSTESSQRSSLAKTLTGKFRRQRKGLSSSDLSPPTDDPDSPASPVTMPSEDDYHLALDGPFTYLTIRSRSWESKISDITMRFEDPDTAKYLSQEWWWGVTAEGFGRWFPTAYVSKAVEAAEGFLSAQSIHSKKKAASTPLEYVSDEDSLDAGSSGVADHPSQIGVADSRTLPTRAAGGDVLFKAKMAEQQEAHEKGAASRADGALSVYSGRQQRHAKEVETEIKKYSEIVTNQREKFRREHPDLANALFTLAVLHSRNRAIPMAIECAAEALRIQKALGELQDAARSLHFLADIYLHQKQYSTSLTFYTEALRLEKSHYGMTSDEAVKTLNCIGTVYSLQNDFALAMESHQEALRILKECHGENLKHPLVSETLCQIGAVYYRERNSFTKMKPGEDYKTFIEAGMLETIGRAHEDRGSYKLAISFFEENLQFLESRVDPKDDNDMEEVAETLNSLGMLSARAGFYVEAIDYYERALKLQLKLGCDAVQVATARVLTGSVHYQLGDWQKALRLHLEALEVLREELGDDHQTVAATLCQIGVVRAALCEFDQAMSVFMQCLAIQKRLLGNDHAATLRTRREIANLYSMYKSGTESALEQFDEVLAAQRAIHGDRHPNIAETLLSIGRTYARRNEFPSALQILEECYYMRTEFLGWDHPHQATTLHEICQIHLKRGRINKALHICDVILEIRRESLSEEHIDVALALATKASCLVAQEKMEEATSTFADALAMAEDAVGLMHPSIADIQLQIGTMHLRKCKFEDARSYFEKAITIYEDAQLADDYPGLVEAKEKLNRVERDEMLCV